MATADSESRLGRERRSNEISILKVELTPNPQPHLCLTQLYPFTLAVNHILIGMLVYLTLILILTLTPTLTLTLIKACKASSAGAITRDWFAV